MLNKIKDPTFISVTESTKEHPYTGYKAVKIPFSNLHKLVQKYPYSMHTLKDGYRNGNNVTFTGNLLVVDIDNDKEDPSLHMSLEEAKKLASPYKSLIITTGSHQKPKPPHKADDRYRILFFLETPLDPTQAEYPALVEDCLEELGFLRYCDGGASTDKAKYFKVSPVDAIYHYSESSTSYDWTKHDTPPPVEEIKYSSNNNYESDDLQDIKENMSYEFLAFHCGVPLPKTKESQAETHYSCPFHNSSGKTSFHVSKGGKNKNMFICHGCGNRGSVIDFTMRALNLDKARAIKFIKELNKQ